MDGGASPLFLCVFGPCYVLLLPGMEEREEEERGREMHVNRTERVWKNKGGERGGLSLLLLPLL